VWLRSALTFVALFVVCLAVVLPNGRATKITTGGVPANARAPRLFATLGNSDSNRYLRTGYNIADARGIPSDTPDAWRDRLVLDFWPPGMPFYYAVLFTAFGQEMPVGVVAGTSAALLWALLLSAYVETLGRHLHRAIALGVVAVMLLTDAMRSWVFADGLLWSEGLYLWCLLAALLAGLYSAAARSSVTRLAWAAAVGLLLGLAAYIRSVADLFGWLMLSALAVWAAALAIRALFRRAHASSAAAPGESWKPQFLALACCVLAFQAVTVPWRIYAEANLRPDDFGWSTEANKLWHDAWTPDRVLRAQGHEWLAEGRSNTPCHVDRSRCREIARYELRQPYPYTGQSRYTEARYRELAIESLTAYPVEFVVDRAAHLRIAWFWAPTSRSPELLENGMLTVTTLLALALAVRRMFRHGPELVALLYPGIVAVTLAPLVFFHYEARYFFPIKLLSIPVIAILLALDPLPRGRSTRLPGFAADRGSQHQPE
jgi:hypothetical protein